MTPAPSEPRGGPQHFAGFRARQVARAFQRIKCVAGTLRIRYDVEWLGDGDVTVPFLQPYWYDCHGLSDVLEIPIHGWHDCVYRDEVIG